TLFRPVNRTLDDSPRVMSDPRESIIDMRRFHQWMCTIILHESRNGLYIGIGAIPDGYQPDTC
ncbi:MAG TPA: hypothetical protein VN289_00810, partial [Paraburkholderia sp.]|nr:hypothetical protein [Paraburkholderia sp.]